MRLHDKRREYKEKTATPYSPTATTGTRTKSPYYLLVLLPYLRWGSLFDNAWHCRHYHGFVAPVQWHLRQGYNREGCALAKKKLPATAYYYQSFFRYIHGCWRHRKYCWLSATRRFAQMVTITSGIDYTIVDTINVLVKAGNFQRRLWRHEYDRHSEGDMFLT